MKKILWLASWYPNKTDRSDGDFIQRHARAAALYDFIYVLNVSKVTKSNAGDFPDEISITGNLTERIVYNKTNFSTAGKLFSLINYYRLHRKYIKEYIREYGVPDLVHVHVPVKAGIIAMWIKRKYRVPFVVTEHYSIYNDVVPERFNKRPYLYRYLTRKIVADASALLPVSRQLGEAMNTMVLSKPFTVVPNVVDTGNFNYLPPPEGRFRFIHASNMVPRKNVKGILNALRQLTADGLDIELLLVGAISDEVMAHAKSVGLPEGSVRFEGEVPYEQVGMLMNSSHALVLFSYSENLPCVILESFCCGRPVISTAVGGIPEVITNQNGLLVDAGNVHSLAAAMKDIVLNYNRYNLQEIAQNARAQYNYEIVGAQLNGIYNNLSF